MGGLLNPPAEVDVRDAELAVGFIAAFPVLDTTRRAGAEAVVVGFFAAVEPAVVGLAGVGAAAGFDAGASVCCTTSTPSASDMLAGWASVRMQE